MYGFLRRTPSPRKSDVDNSLFIEFFETLWFLLSHTLSSIIDILKDYYTITILYIKEGIEHKCSVILLTTQRD
jgi:hypothetical protein